jgi:hypothetical protein
MDVLSLDAIWANRDIITHLSWRLLYCILTLVQQELVVFLGEIRFSPGKPTGIEISLSCDENVNNDQALWAR